MRAGGGGLGRRAVGLARRGRGYPQFDFRSGPGGRAPSHGSGGWNKRLAERPLNNHAALGSLRKSGLLLGPLVVSTGWWSLLDVSQRTA